MKISFQSLLQNRAGAQFLARNSNTTSALGKSPEAEKRFSEITGSSESDLAMNREKESTPSLTIAPLSSQKSGVALTRPDRGFMLSIFTDNFVDQYNHSDLLLQSSDHKPQSPPEFALRAATSQGNRTPMTAIANTAFLLSNSDLVTDPSIVSSLQNDRDVATATLENRMISTAEDHITSATIRSQITLDSSNTETAQFLALNIGGVSSLANSDPNTQASLATNTDALMTVISDVIATEAASYFTDQPETPLTKDFFVEHTYAALSVLEDNSARADLQQSQVKQRDFVENADSIDSDEMAGAVERARSLLGNRYYFSENQYYKSYYPDATRSQLQANPPIFTEFNDHTATHEAPDPFTLLIDLTTRANAAGALPNGDLDISSTFTSAGAFNTAGGTRTVNLQNSLREAIAQKAADLTPSDVNLNADFYKRNIGIGMVVISNPQFREALQNDKTRINQLFSANSPVLSQLSVDQALTQRHDANTARRALLAYSLGLSERETGSSALSDVLKKL